jgi:hypothetical protein
VGEVGRQVKRAELTREWSGGGQLAGGSDALGRPARRPELIREYSGGAGNSNNNNTDGRQVRRAELTREWSGNGNSARAELVREKSAGGSTTSVNAESNDRPQPLRRKSKSFNSFGENPRSVNNVNAPPSGSVCFHSFPIYFLFLFSFFFSFFFFFISFILSISLYLVAFVCHVYCCSVFFSLLE